MSLAFKCSKYVICICLNMRNNRAFSVYILDVAVLICVGLYKLWDNLILSNG